MRQRNKRNIVIGILCVMVVFMSVGYAVLSQNLTISGTGNINGSWKIEITSISPQNINEGESISTSIADSKIEGSFTANLKKPTDAVVYTVTVENKGTIDAVLESITPEDYSEGDIKYTTTGKEECKNLDAGSSCDFTIKVEYLDTGVGQIPTPNGTKVEQEFEIKYVQEGASVNIPDNGNDNEEIIVNESAFKVTDNGLLLHYERQGDETTVVVPGEVSKTPVQQTSFNTSNNNVVGNLLNDEIKEFKQAKTSTEKIQIKEIAPYAFIDADAIVANNSSLIIVINMDYIELGKQLAQINGMTLTTIDEFGHGSDPFEITNVNQKMTVDMSKPQIAVDSTEYDSNYYLTDLDLSNMIYLEKIGDSAFENFDLTKISLPTDGVLTSIGDRAFIGNQISEITIPESVTTIGEFILSNSGFFRKIEINAENIPEDLIYVSPDELVIEKLIIGPNVKSISNGMFYKGQGLVTIRNLNIDAEIIPDQIFNSRKIENLIIGPNVKIIKDGAFKDNQITGTLNIPESVKELSGFDNNLITNIIFEKNTSITTIGRNAFANNQISALTIPYTVTTIGPYAFSNNKLNESTLVFEDTEQNPSKLTYLAGFNSNQFTQVPKLPQTVTTIGQSAFGTNQISELTIPANIEKIEWSAFSNNQINESTLVFEDTEQNPSKLTYLAGFSSNQFKKQPEIPSSVTTIGIYAFTDNRLNEISIPTSVTTIEEHAFSYNYTGGSLIIPTNVKIIGKEAFSMNNFSSLLFEDTIEKPSQLTYIGDWAFWDNSISGDVIIPASITHIGGDILASNGVKKLIIKRPDSTGMTFGDYWDNYNEVIFDPNYTG